MSDLCVFLICVGVVAILGWIVFVVLDICAWVDDLYFMRKDFQEVKNVQLENLTSRVEALEKSEKKRRLKNDPQKTMELR